MIEEMKREVMQSRKEIKEELSVIRKLLEPRLIKRPLLEQRGDKVVNGSQTRMMMMRSPLLVYMHLRRVTPVGMSHLKVLHHRRQ